MIDLCQNARAAVCSITHRCDGVKHVKVIMESEKYGLSTSETFDSLLDLVIHYSQHPFITPHTFLLFPLFGN